MISGGGGRRSQPDEALLRFEHLSVRYPARREPAIVDATLELHAGEMVGVAGATGAGKSTLSLVAAGFIPRVVGARLDGSATTVGVPVRAATSADLAGHVGIVFSTPANQLSAAKTTVREELAFGLENLGIPRATMDERIDDTLSRLGIHHLADRDPFALSGGEQQRVGIASIAAMGTSLLVLDEPTAQLDPGGVASVASLLTDLAATGTTILCAEHASDVLARMNRCLVLDAGRTVAVDVPGAALSSTVLDRCALRPPTLVRLAELAGVPAAAAFDEDAITQGLRRFGAPAFRSETWPTRRDPDLVDISPVREHVQCDIAVRGLTHRYGEGIIALAGIDLEITPGESVAIVGENGCGKTTLAKHLIGLLRPTEGSILLRGRDIAQVAVSELAKTVGFVFQNPDDQLFERTIEREVSFGARNLGLDRATTAALTERAISMTGLDGVRQTNPYDLTFSDRKLVGLASVLAMEPSVLVLDEPTTGQDSPGIERIGAIVEAYARAGRTVVTITHDMEFAARHCGRVLVMRAGSIVADGDPRAVFAPRSQALLASTGLVPPPSARIGARLNLGSTPTDVDLLTALRAHNVRLVGRRE